MHELSIWTIGHSTHGFEEFASLLKHYNIKVLADIRSFPGSKRYPHFNREYMENAFPLQSIGYMHFKKPGICSESLWWRCHRSLVADHFKSKGWNVIHIMAKGKATEHPYTAPAKIVNGRLSYSGDYNLFNNEV